MSGFVDQAQLHARAGDGGAGAVAFRREAHVSKGGPDGGDGGHGGDVWLVTTVNQASLLAFRDHPHRRAGDGGHGGGKRRRGARGGDLEVPVPVGTVVRDLEGTVLADLSAPSQRWLAASGGRGGHGNAHFLSNRRRAPAFAEQGERGEERWLDLELKLVADVAIVGMPNAGKSTLISTISAAKPKIADYPFTTLEPHLGVVRLGARRNASDEEPDMVVADIPGLVEGAALGRGLGHQFLRHVERARVLLILLDLVPMDGLSARRQLEVLLRELGQYRPELLERPRLVVGSKADAAPGPGDEPLDPDMPETDLPEMDMRVSAATGEGLSDMVHRLADLVAAARRERAGVAHAEVVVHRPLGEGVTVERSGPGRWVVHGRTAERAVAFHDLTEEGALEEAIRRLRRLGVDRALNRAGVRDGDEVQIGVASFTWEREA